MIPSAPFLFRLSLYLCLFVATGAPQESTANAAESKSTYPTNEVRRFAGWLTSDDGCNTCGVTLFIDVSGKYAIAFRPPSSIAELSALGTNDALQVWLLTTNGAAMELLHHSVVWQKGYSNGIPCACIPSALFVFEPTAPMSALCALVIKMGDTMQILKIPSLVDGLSGEAQHQWDILASFPIEKLDAFEAGGLNANLNNQDRAFIESAKNRLRDLGVTLTWDRHNRKYIVNGE
jgi:hypothetical protein